MFQVFHVAIHPHCNVFHFRGCFRKKEANNVDICQQKFKNKVFLQTLDKIWGKNFQWMFTFMMRSHVFGYVKWGRRCLFHITNDGALCIEASLFTSKRTGCLRTATFLRRHCLVLNNFQDQASTSWQVGAWSWNFGPTQRPWSVVVVWSWSLSGPVTPGVVRVGAQDLGTNVFGLSISVVLQYIWWKVFHLHKRKVWLNQTEAAGETLMCKQIIFSLGSGRKIFDQHAWQFSTMIQIIFVQHRTICCLQC